MPHTSRLTILALDRRKTDVAAGLGAVLSLPLEVVRLVGLYGGEGQAAEILELCLVARALAVTLDLLASFQTKFVDAYRCGEIGMLSWSLMSTVNFYILRAQERRPLYFLCAQWFSQ